MSKRSREQLESAAEALEVEVVDGVSDEDLREALVTAVKEEGE